MTEQSVNAVLFDMDGTITRPILDFGAIRRAIGVTDGVPVLEYLDRLDPAGRERGYAILEQFESDAAEKAEFHEGVAELLSFLQEARIPIGLVTRNSRRSIEITLERLGLRVAVSVGREDAPVKPSPEPALLAARQIGVEPANCLFVGDYDFDVITGVAAGMRTVLIPSRPPKPTCPKPDYAIGNARDLVPIIRGLNRLPPPPDTAGRH
jgi:HAD superfamily hydrolase (TIGR01509 family)